MTERTADEAHAIHESEVRDWLRAFDADPHLARHHIPVFIYRLLHDLQYLVGDDSLSEKGAAVCAD